MDVKWNFMDIQKKIVSAALSEITAMNQKIKNIIKKHSSLLSSIYYYFMNLKSATIIQYTIKGRFMSR